MLAELTLSPLRRAVAAGLSVTAVGAGLGGTALLLARGVVGDGPLTVSGPVAAEGLSALLVICSLWSATATAARHRPMIVWLLRVLAVLSVLWVSGSSIGRSVGLVAIASVMVAHAALVTWRPFPSSPRRARHVAWIALPPLVLSQIVWAAFAMPAPTIALLLSALGVVQLHQDERWGFDERYEGWASRLETRRRGGISRIQAVGDRGRSAVLRPSDGARSVRRPTFPGFDRWDAAIILVSVAMMAPIWYRFSSSPSAAIGTSDFETHLRVAGELSLIPLRITAPHFGYHLPVAVLTPLIGAVAASVLVLSVGVGVTTAVLIWIGRSRFAERAGLSSNVARAAALLFFLIESPSVIARSLTLGEPYDWATTIHAYYNPTDTLAVGFSLLQLGLVARVLRPGANLDGRVGRQLAIVTIVSATVKPSMTLVLLCASVPSIWSLGGPAGRTTRHLARYFALPGAIVVVGQTLLLQIGSADLPEAGIAVELLGTWRVLQLDRAGPLLFSAMLVVPLCLWAGARRYVREPMVMLSLWGLLGGVAVLLLFRETGERSMDGTFAKPAFMAASVLAVVSWRFLAGEASAWWGQRRTSPALPLWLVATAAFLAVNLVAGVLSYLEGTGLIVLPTALIR
jgi:hypothetical protein